MASSPRWRWTNGNGLPRPKRNFRRPTGPKQSLFGTSSQVLTFDSQANGRDDDEGLRFNDDADDSENGEEEDITPDGRDTCRSNHRPFIQSLPSTSAKERIDIKYVESGSDLSDDEERILTHDGHNILEDDEAMDDDE